MSQFGLSPQWMVYATGQTFSEAHPSPQFAWVAHGHRGSQSGVEDTAQAALEKAHAAMVLMTEPRAGR